MPNGGVLTIETSNVTLREDSKLPESVKIVPGPYVVLTVSDTGVGMEGQTRARIFEPFFTTKEKDKGTGLGLATVYGIVKQLGGYIWVDSEPGRGTRFTLHLPATSETADASDAGLSSVTSAELAETILLVEDEDAVRRFACRALKGHGYQVLEAATPDEALAIVAENPPIDLVLTDVVMPGLSGPDLLARIRDRRPVHGLLMTGYIEKLVMNRDGNSNVLEKPFESNELLRLVRRALETTPSGLDAQVEALPPPA